MRTEAIAALAALHDGARQIVRPTSVSNATYKGHMVVERNVDAAVEAAIKERLLDVMPGCSVIGEESGGDPRAAAGPYWLVDPICGTRLFESGIAAYCTNVALVEQGEVALAAVRAADGQLYVAERDGGAWRSGTDGWTKLGVSDASRVVCVDAGAASSGPWLEKAATFLARALASQRWYVFVLGSSSVFAQLAAGAVAAVVCFRLFSPVHHAAGALLAREAGAVLSDLDGAPWTLDCPTLLAAASASVRDEIRQLIAGEALR